MRHFSYATTLSVTLGATLLAAPPAAHAGGVLRNWMSTIGGTFEVDTNWSPLGVPSLLDTARIDAGTLYTITLSLSQASELLIVDDVDVTFTIPPLATYALKGIVLGDQNTAPGRLTISSGTIDVTPLVFPQVPHRVRIGKVLGAVGQMTVSADATFSTMDTVLLGDAGTGSILVTGGGTLSTALMSIADDVGSSGTLTITGVGSTWTANAGTGIGNEGSGTLDIVAGGAATSLAPARIGDNAGSLGDVTVDGLGSTWTLTAGLAVGNSGTGTLVISNGGAVSSTNVNIGDGLGSTGTATFIGPGSTWTYSNTFAVGNSGTGTLNVSGGVTLSGFRGRVGDNLFSHGTATIQGPGTAWTNTNELLVGHLGTGSLTLADRAGATAPTLTVGHTGSGEFTLTSGSTASFTGVSHLGDLPGSSGTINVTGPGSTLSFASSVFVGNFGTGTLNVLDGGTVTCLRTFLGDDLGSGGTLVVDGAGSTFTAQLESFIGNVATGSISATNGGALVTSRVKIGDEIGSTGTATVDGSGSTWTDSVEIFVGNFGTGSLTVSNGATVSGARGTIGDDPGSVGTAVVDGPGSAWNNTVQLVVSRLGQGSLTLLNGSTVSAPLVTVGVAGLVQGNGTLIGAVTNSGTVRPGTSGGELAVDGSYVQTASGSLDMELTCGGGGVLAVSGTAQLAGTLNLSTVFGLEPTLGQQFTILTGAAVSGTFVVNAPIAVDVAYGPTAVVVTALQGPAPSPGDLDGDGFVGITDFLALLAAWGPNPGHPADFDNDGLVGITDFLTLLANWGPVSCP